MREWRCAVDFNLSDIIIQRAHINCERLYYQCFLPSKVSMIPKVKFSHESSLPNYPESLINPRITSSRILRPSVHADGVHARLAYVRRVVGWCHNRATCDVSWDIRRQEASVELCSHSNLHRLRVLSASLTKKPPNVTRFTILIKSCNNVLPRSKP